MKSLLLVLCLMGLVVLPCLAQEPAASAGTKPTPAVVVKKTITGIVKSVTLADPVKGTKSEIVIVDKTGSEPKEYTFLVESTTTIYNVNWESTTLDNIKQDNQVKITYLANKEGAPAAASIRITE